MLRQITELVPFGNDSQCKNIAVTYIANCGNVGDGLYEYMIGYFSDTTEPRFLLIYFDLKQELYNLLNSFYRYEKEKWFDYEEATFHYSSNKSVIDIFMARAKKDLK
jgi:hypothetical protein